MDALYSRFKPYTLLTEAKCGTLRQLAERVNREQVEGAFVECGVARGGSAALLASVLGTRDLWLFDSFQGMPPTTTVDGRDAENYIGLCKGDPGEVRELVLSTGLDENRLRISEGLFSTTFRGTLPERVALLHCDADWYESVSLVLDTFYPRIPDGGAVILDDFGCWEGCREAFYDFCRRTGEKPLLERVEYDQTWWIKGRRHNR